MLVLSWPLSSNSRYTSENDADEAVSVVSLISSSGGYINGRNSATNLGLLIDKTSSIYVKLKALASWIFLSFTRFWRNLTIQRNLQHSVHKTKKNKTQHMLDTTVRKQTQITQTKHIILESRWPQPSFNYQIVFYTRPSKDITCNQHIIANITFHHLYAKFRHNTFQQDVDIFR